MCRSLFCVNDASEISSVDGKLTIISVRIERVFTCCTRLQNRIFDTERLISIGIYISDKKAGGSMLKAPSSLRFLLKRQGCSEEAVEEIWKWYAFDKRKGAASF